jgi:hypothetical protein
MIHDFMTHDSTYCTVFSILYSEILAGKFSSKKCLRKIKSAFQNLKKVALPPIISFLFEKRIRVCTRRQLKS